MIHLLCDTHIFLWLATGQLHRIRRKTLELLRDFDNPCYLSVVSVVESEIKMAIGKLNFFHDWEIARAKNSCLWLNYESRHALALRNLPLIHRDPFDRMLAAQALAEDFTLVTADESLLAYPIKILRA